MAANIIQQIVDLRTQNIKDRGFELGYKIPEKRQRPVHPFMKEKGAILEIKRASPSKGDIAPDLVAPQLAVTYARAGARAISCLTEENYFKGSLQDLMEVCNALDEYERSTGNSAPAVLRKDFLTSPEDIEVAYRAGADAVLLIARMLDDNTILIMAKKCAELKLSALIEVRTEDDVKKLTLVKENVPEAEIVSGINSRDLKDFTIDLLKPCTLFSKIQQLCGKDTKVIFESGIRTPQAADFAGSLGFNGMLLGEAAAKNPEKAKELVEAFENSTETKNADFWKNYSNLLKEKKLPLIKICGITNYEDFVKCTEGNTSAEFTGTIFSEISPRNVKDISFLQNKNSSQKNAALNTPLKTAVITDPKSAEGKKAVELCKDGTIDVIQLHGIDCVRKFLNQKENAKLPHYAAINLNTEEDLKILDELFLLGEPRVLLDACTKNKIGGTGKQISSDLLKLAEKKYPLWIAGGITPENVSEIINLFSPEVIDISSGVEEKPGKKSHTKIDTFFNNVRNAQSK